MLAVVGLFALWALLSIAVGVVVGRCIAAAHRYAHKDFDGYTY